VHDAISLRLIDRIQELAVLRIDVEEGAIDHMSKLGGHVKV